MKQACSPEHSHDAIEFERNSPGTELSSANADVEFAMHLKKFGRQDRQKSVDATSGAGERQAQSGDGWLGQTDPFESRSM